MTNFFSNIVQKLAQAHIEHPRLEARMIFAEVLHCRPDEVYSGIPTDSSCQTQIEKFTEERIKGCPLDKVLGHKAFYKAEFITGRQVLSPRPDTEILVEEAVKLIKEHEAATVLDLGTGSGCIILSMLQEFPTLYGTAADISPAALRIAAENAERLGIGNRIDFVEADWFSADFCHKFSRCFDIIVSNPPYIPSTDIAGLDVEVREYDPLAALDGGADGFDSYRRIAMIAPKLLAKNGYILLEAGINQAEQIAQIFTQAGLQHIRTVRDLAGIDRCVILKK